MPFFLRKPRAIDTFTALNPLAALECFKYMKSHLREDPETYFANPRASVNLIETYSSTKRKYDCSSSSLQNNAALVVESTFGLLSRADSEFGGLSDSQSTGVAYGTLCVLDIVFAIAPALSSYGPKQTRDITTDILYRVSSSYNSESPGSFLVGAGGCFAMFGVAIDCISWLGLPEMERVKREKMWLEGYDQRTDKWKSRSTASV